MKILWVKPGKLLPLDTGGKIRTYNILRHLSAAHVVTYLSYYGGHQDKQYEQEITKKIPGTVPVASGFKSPTGARRYLDYLRHLLHPAPYAVSQFSGTRVRKMIENWMRQQLFDVAICDFLASTMTFPQKLSIPTVLFQHNVESLLWNRRARFEQKPLDRMIATVESMKMKRFEPSQVRRFHHVLAVSEGDAQILRKMAGADHVTVVPTGVDLSTYQCDLESGQQTEPSVMFTGSMDWAPNVDAVEYFSQAIWPLVLAKVPAARFRIVGRSPSSRVRGLASNSIEVTGTVTSIVDHLWAAAVMVVPLRAAGGTRLKIYEAMAMGKATVSTSVGAEGLDVNHGRDILLADSPQEFAENVVNLLTDGEKRRTIGAAAAATAQKYDWSVVTDLLVRALRKTIERAEPVRISPGPVVIGA